MECVCRRKWQPTPVFLPGEFPWTEEPGRLQSMGSQESDMIWMVKPSSSNHIHVRYMCVYKQRCVYTHIHICIFFFFSWTRFSLLNFKSVRKTAESDYIWSSLFFPLYVACRILVPQPLTKPRPQWLEVPSPKWWTTKQLLTLSSEFRTTCWLQVMTELVLLDFSHSFSSWCSELRQNLNPGVNDHTFHFFLFFFFLTIQHFRSWKVKIIKYNTFISHMERS